MTAFIAFWPDSTISVLSYPAGHEDETYEAWLFDDLDAEADPLDAKVYRLPPGYHIQTKAWIGKHKKTGRQRACISVTSFHLDYKRPRRLTWSPDASFKRWNRVRMSHRKERASQNAGNHVAQFCSDDSAYPPIPSAVFSVEEVRAMESFAGIYIAICETTGAVRYVGKSSDVTRRVSNSRQELSGCKLAVIKMPEADIHFAELHYIAKCRPTRNKVGGQCCRAHEENGDTTA
jgi:hypothetical protein